MARNSRYLRPRPLLLLLHHIILILFITAITLCHGFDDDTMIGFQEETPIRTTTSNSFDQINANEEPSTSTTATTTITSTKAYGDQLDSNLTPKPVSTTPASSDVQMELIRPANTTEIEPTTLDPIGVENNAVTLEPLSQMSQLVRNRKSSESFGASKQHQANETVNRRIESDKLPEQAASTVSSLDYDDFDLDYQIKLNNSDSNGTKRDYDSAGPPKPPTWSALIRQPHVFTPTNINQTLPTTVAAHQAPHIPPALLTVKSTQLSSQELDKIKNQLLMFQDQYDSFGAEQSLAFANGDLLATASHGTVSPSSILALNGSVLNLANTNITNLRKLAMDLQSSGMPSIAPLMLENLLLQAKLLPNRSNLFPADETSSITSGSDISSHSSSETTPLSLGSGSFTTQPSTSSKGSSQMNQWHNYPHPNIHQNPLLLHHILNKPTFYTQQLDQQQQSDSDLNKINQNSDIAIAGTASTPIQHERPTSSPAQQPTQESTRLHDFSSQSPSTSSSRDLFLDNLQHLQAQQKRAILSSTFNNLQRLSGNVPQPLISLPHAVTNHRPASWINQPLWQTSDAAKTPGVSSQILASPSLLREFYAPQPFTSNANPADLTAKQELLLKLLKQRQLLQQQVLQNKSETRQASISDEDMSTYVSQLSQHHFPSPTNDQMAGNRQANSDVQIADLLKHLRTSNSGLNLTELELAVQNLLDAHTVSVQPQDSSKSTTTTNELNSDINGPPSKLQASNWHRRPTVHVAPPLDSAHLLKVLASENASASNQSSINVAPLEQTPDQQQSKDNLAEQLLNRKKQIAFIEALKMKLQQQASPLGSTDGSINSGNSLDEIFALGSGESNGTTSGGDASITTNDFDDQVSNKQIPKWLERQILQGGFVHQSARSLPTIGKTIRTTYIGRPPIATGAHNMGPLFFRPAASQLQLIRQPTLMSAPLGPQPLVRLGPQQALQLLLGNTQFSLQRLPPPPQDQQIVAKIVTQDSPSVVANTQSNQSQTKLLAESFPLASAPAYLIKLPTLTGGTITASGSFTPPSMRFLRGRPLVPLRVLSAPSRIRLVPAAATPSSQSLSSNHNKNTGSSIQQASSMVHTQHQFPPIHPLMNPHFLHAQLLHQQHQQQQQQYHQQLIQQQQLLRPLLAMASFQQQVPHLAYNPANFAASIPSQIPPPTPLQPDPIVEPNSLLNIPPPAAVPSTSAELASGQAARFQQLYPSASQISISDNQNVSSSSPRPPINSAAASDGPFIITDGSSSGGPKMNAALSRLQQATASLVELTSLASLVDEMAGSDLDPSPAVAIVQALSSLQHNNAASGNQQSLQYQVDGTSPQITPPLTLKSLLNGHLWHDRQLSKIRDMNNLERLVAAANAANAAKGTQARLKVKYIRVPVAVYESTNEPVLTGSRSIFGQAQLADLAAAVREKQTSTSGNSDSSTSTTSAGGEQQSLGSVASPSSTNYMFDELSSDSSPHLALALQELAQKQPVDQNELLSLASSYRNSLNDNQGQLIDPLELYVSLTNVQRIKSMRPAGGRKKRARKGRKKELDFETIDETGDMDAEATTELDEDDRVTRKDLPILESLINTILHGPQPMYAPMYSPMPLDSHGSPWYRNRHPLRAEASGIVESYVPHPMRHHHHHWLNPFTRHRFTLGEIVGALGAKKIITSLLSKSRRSRTSKRTISQGSGIALAGGQSALTASGQPVQNSSSSANGQQQVASMNQPTLGARPNPVFVWFPVGSDSSSGKRTKSKLVSANKTPLHGTASVIHGAQKLTSGNINSTNGSLWKKSYPLSSSTTATMTTSTGSTASPSTGTSTNLANGSQVSSSPKIKLNNHKPHASSPSYNFKSFFQASAKVNQSSVSVNLANNSSAISMEEHRRRGEVTAIPLYHVVADHYSKLYSEPTTQLAKHPNIAEPHKHLQSGA